MLTDNTVKMGPQSGFRVIIWTKSLPCGGGGDTYAFTLRYASNDLSLRVIVNVLGAIPHMAVPSSRWSELGLVEATQ